jgi:LysR family transcriptional regulator, benzoate and cis,cis-muconate-responsive activator of ben and cat genes
MSITDQLQNIKSGRIDLGFLRDPSPDDTLDSRIIYEETYAIVLPINHPVSVENFEGLHQLANENFIQLPRFAGERFFDKLLLLFHKAGVNPRIVHQSGHGSTVMKLVENNLGISIIPSSLMQGFNFKVKFIELTNIQDRALMSVVWRKDNSNPALKTFLKVIGEV